MDEDTNTILKKTEKAMSETVSYYVDELRNIRAGKANPRMLSTVTVDYYGAQTPLNQVGNISAPDAQTLTVRPFEKSMIGEIEKGIQVANLGFNPMNNGESVIINVPPLTEERRKELTKQAKSEGEEAKISVRNERQNANNTVKKMEISEDLQHDVENKVQKLTDDHVKKIDDRLEAKEKEIMTV